MVSGPPSLQVQEPSGGGSVEMLVLGPGIRRLWWCTVHLGRGYRSSWRGRSSGAGVRSRHQAAMVVSCPLGPRIQELPGGSVTSAGVRSRHYNAVDGGDMVSGPCAARNHLYGIELGYGYGGVRSTDGGASPCRAAVAVSEGF